ncbi:MAG: hypothetical protein UX31_C0004G0009 [Candidatus Nomurabacteria bacterium GW2011_GWA1_46_11]|uniref:Uncharacterized protein n=1 Tax=Candidatus Nomurabacteria bacterium GW2011_GWA1_46_11 TaxID=1618732 RepID=A0A0G1RMY1_9BACT|nr:MAG: hypothetical protein UX31_C0004G0009 [Candidatus Nomurabacteria bacterium GW2011_GWA1_46_11]
MTLLLETQSPPDETGTVTGAASQMRDVGFDVALVGTPTAVATAAAATGTDSGLFTIVFDVTAWDGSIFIDGTDPDDAGSTAAGVGTEHDLGVTGTGTLLADITTLTGATEAGGSFTVLDGETERFQIVVDVRDGAVDLVDAFHSVSLDVILYALAQGDGDLGYALNLGDFVTPSIYLNDGAEA